MKIINITGLVAGILLVGGCASTPSVDSGPEGLEAAAELAENLDSDGDSVPDGVDVCADTDAGVMVDPTGCEIVMGRIDGLDFGPNQVSLPADAQPVLDRYIEAMLRYPDVVVSVDAHTDNRGTALGNRELSKERVISVVRYMVVSGISPNRIKPKGWGESRPIAANATAEGREQNRRIEINVLEGLL